MVAILEPNLTGAEYVKRFSKQMLKNTLFIGTFHEKRFVNCLNGYRDVVSISGDEKEFIQNLVTVKKKMEREFIQFPWIGITDSHGIGTPAGYNLWVELPVEVFGTYWFKVRTVEFHKDEVTLKLEVIRPVKNDNSHCENVASQSQNNLSTDRLNITLSDIQFWLREHFWHFYKNILTKENIKSLVIFSSILISTVVLGFFDIIKYLLEYFLKLINELTKLIHTLTPIIINVLNLFGKAIFGLFQLIVTLFARKPPPQPVYNAYITYDPRTGVPNSFNWNKSFPNIQNRSSATVKPIMYY